MISLDFCLLEKKWREQWFCCLLHFVWIYIYQFVLCGHLMPGLTVAKLRMTRLMSEEECVEVMQNWIWFEQAFVWNGFSFSVNTNSTITLHNHLYNALFMNLVVHFSFFQLHTHKSSFSNKVRFKSSKTLLAISDSWWEFKFANSLLKLNNLNEVTSSC